MGKLGKVGMKNRPCEAGAQAIVFSVRYETVPAAAYVHNLDGVIRLTFESLTYVVNVPLGQFLSIARIRLVALRLCNKRLIIDNIW